MRVCGGNSRSTIFPLYCIPFKRTVIVASKGQKETPTMYYSKTTTCKINQYFLFNLKTLYLKTKLDTLPTLKATNSCVICNYCSLSLLHHDGPVCCWRKLGLEEGGGDIKYALLTFSISIIAPYNTTLQTDKQPPCPDWQ